MLCAFQVLPARRGIGRKSLSDLSPWERQLARSAEGALQSESIHGGKAKHTSAMAAFQAESGTPFPQLVPNVHWLEVLGRMLLRSFGWGLQHYANSVRLTPVGPGDKYYRAEVKVAGKPIERLCVAKSGTSPRLAIEKRYLGEHELLQALHICQDMGS
eukprot:3854713-Amphidinium_carterae.1